MQVQILKHFVDQRSGILYGKGLRDLSTPLAEKFLKEKKAVLPGRVPREEQTGRPKVILVENQEGGDDSGLNDATESDLPEDFPEREKLIANGLGTIALLSVSDAREKIEAIKGIGPVRVSDIGIALSELIAQSL